MNTEKFLQIFKENIKASVTVACVSIPLSIAISIASGAGPVPGIITGFWATIVASFFGGSNYNIIGPAGALTSILFAATAGGVVGLTGPAVLPIIALFTGIIILVIYALKGERYIRYIPASVVHGFAAGVAFVIASTQLREAFGLVSFFKAKGEFVHDFENIILNLNNTDIKTFSVFISFFIFLILWKKYIKKIPGVIPATVLGILAGYIFKTQEIFTSVKTVGDRYGDLKLSLISMPDFSVLNTILSSPDILFSILKVSGVVAIIAILETLITAKIGDKLTGTRFDVRKETGGLSISNIVSGLFGGLPSTGVFIRTGLNIASGATSKYAGVMAGVLTGLGAVLCFPFIKYIPMSVIAAMLMMTAIGLIDIKSFKHLYAKSKKDFYIGIVTIVTVLLFDPGIAVLVGTVIGLLYLLEKTTTGSAEISFYNGKDLVERISSSDKIPEVKKEYDTVVLGIGGFLSYIDIEKYIDNLEEISKISGLKKIGLRMRNLEYLDFEAAEEFFKSVGKIEKQGVKVFVSSVGEFLTTELQKIPEYRKIEEAGLVYKNTANAL